MGLISGLVFLSCFIFVVWYPALLLFDAEKFSLFKISLIMGTDEDEAMMKISRSMVIKCTRDAYCNLFFA